MRTRMNFGQACAHLRTGQRVARASWDDQHWLLLVRPLPLASLGVSDSSTPSEPGAWAIGLWLTSQSFGNEWHGPPRLLPWIGICSVRDNAFAPWTANAEDMMADDWIDPAQTKEVA